MKVKRFYIAQSFNNKILLFKTNVCYPLCYFRDILRSYPI